MVSTICKCTWYFETRDSEHMFSQEIFFVAIENSTEKNFVELGDNVIEFAFVNGKVKFFLILIMILLKLRYMIGCTCLK